MPFATASTDRTVVRLVEAGVEDDYWWPTGIVHAWQPGESRTVCGLPAGEMHPFAELAFPPAGIETCPVCNRRFDEDDD
jgi:hypothetical protein